MQTTNDYFTNPEIEDYLKKADVIVYDLSLIVDGAREARPDAIDLINYIFGRTYKPLALATTETPPIIESILGKEGLDILSLFDFISCADRPTKPKPHPEIYERVVEYFGKSRSYLALESSEVGVIAAKAAQMVCIAVPDSVKFFQIFSEADLVINDQSRNAIILSGSEKPNHIISKRTEDPPRP